MPGRDKLSKEGFNNAEGWTEIVSILGNDLELPDLTKRSGLKKAHADFDNIYASMEALYKDNPDDYKIRGAIVLIYAKMCVDTLLQTRLFKKGFLKKVMSLCHIPQTRGLALRALSSITHNGEPDVRLAIAKEANVLATLLRDVPGDENVAEFAILIIAHTVSDLADGFHGPTHPTELRSISMTLLYSSVFEAVKRPHSRPGLMIEHVLELCLYTSLNCAHDMKACPQSIRFLVAGLRTKDWIARAISLESLLRLHRLVAAPDIFIFDPLRFVGDEPFPKRINDALMEYGRPSAIDLICETQGRLIDALDSYAEDRDLCKLGRVMAQAIVSTEVSIPDGENGDVEDDQKHLFPFSRYVDALPLCARALRGTGIARDTDLADILEIKYYLMSGGMSGNEKARAISFRALNRNPEQAYFYYALVMSSDKKAGFCAARQGLECRETTTFVRHQLLQRAVKHAAELGLEIMRTMPADGSHAWNRGIALLEFALADAKVFMMEASPDNRFVKNVGYWLVLLTILTSETLTPDMAELRPVFAKLELADEFGELFGTSPVDTELRMTYKAVVQNYASGVREFGHVFDALDEYKASGEQPVNCHQVGDALLDWLESVHQDDRSLKPSTGSSDNANGSGTKPGDQYLMLYKCSWCTTPSAVLRKCSGCGQARYCDAKCQKAHWLLHKGKCKKS